MAKEARFAGQGKPLVSLSDLRSSPNWSSCGCTSEEGFKVVFEVISECSDIDSSQEKVVVELTYMDMEWR
jgi:hypothetical protein